MNMRFEIQAGENFSVLTNIHKHCSSLAIYLKIVEIILAITPVSDSGIDSLNLERYQRYLTRSLIVSLENLMESFYCNVRN